MTSTASIPEIQVLPIHHVTDSTPEIVTQRKTDHTETTAWPPRPPNTLPLPKMTIAAAKIVFKGTFYASNKRIRLSIFVNFTRAMQVFRLVLFWWKCHFSNEVFMLECSFCEFLGVASLESESKSVLKLFRIKNSSVEWYWAEYCKILFEIAKRLTNYVIAVLIGFNYEFKSNLISLIETHE